MNKMLEAACDRIYADIGKPKPLPTGKAFDALWARSKPYHVCSDGCLRTDEQERAWQQNGGVDELSRLRAQLQRKHCGIGRRVEPGHLCSCTG
jgi:hypothetical protein